MFENNVLTNNKFVEKVNQIPDITPDHINSSRNPIDNITNGPATIYDSINQLTN